MFSSKLTSADGDVFLFSRYKYILWLTLFLIAYLPGKKRLRFPITPKQSFLITYSCTKNKSSIKTETKELDSEKTP